MDPQMETATLYWSIGSGGSQHVMLQSIISLRPNPWICILCAWTWQIIVISQKTIRQWNWKKKRQHSADTFNNSYKWILFHCEGFASDSCECSKYVEHVGSSDRVGWFCFSQLLLFGVILVSVPPPCFAVDGWHPLRTTGQIGVSDYHYQTNVARAQCCVAVFTRCFFLVYRITFVVINWRTELLNTTDYLESTRAPAWLWILTW